MLRGSPPLVSTSARLVEPDRKGGQPQARLLGFKNSVKKRCTGLCSSVSAASEARMANRITHVILDLDGTLLDTERLVEEVYEAIVNGDYGKTWDGSGAQRRLGLRPLESVTQVIADYGLPSSPPELLARRTELLYPKLVHASALPGADRLIRHLKQHGVPVAVATSSPTSSTRVKLESQPGWSDALATVVTGDEVDKGKPAPDIFVEAAKRLNANPASCLVVEDSPHGVTAAKAAGMEVIAVPSLPTKTARPLYAHADHILSSLLDLELERWGLPPFQDWIGRALPIPAWRVGGSVIKGYGRGSKILGIPTANLPTAAFSGALAEQVCGVYLGWAGLADKGVYKMVMSVGWNPYFDNAEKTVEPWLLHEFPDDFYGEELRLVVVGYIRAEANFPSVESLIERIREDGNIAGTALDLPPFSTFRNDPYLTAPLAQEL